MIALLLFAQFLITPPSASAAPIHLSGAELYSQMSTSEKSELEASLTEHDLTIQNFSDFEIDYDLEKAEAQIRTQDPTVKRARRWFVQAGASYLFPIGAGVSTEIGLLTLNRKKMVGLELKAHTTGKFKYGSVNSFDISPRLHTGRVGLNIGPVFQIIHVNNPLLVGEQNFFYKAVGASIGYEFTKVYKKYGWNVGVYGQSTLGGFNKDPNPFILVGGGINISFIRIQKLNRKTIEAP